jgi:hypothetical protein
MVPSNASCILREVDGLALETSTACTSKSNGLRSEFWAAGELLFVVTAGGVPPVVQFVPALRTASLLEALVRQGSNDYMLT